MFKVPLAELAEWDATHDALGRTLGDGGSSEQSVQIGERVTDKA